MNISFVSTPFICPLCTLIQQLLVPELKVPETPTPSPPFPCHALQWLAVQNLGQTYFRN